MTGIERDEFHPPGDAQLWSESWYFDFVARDASVGGFLRVGGYPRLGVAWWWAYVVGAGSVVAGARREVALLPDRAAPAELVDGGLVARVDTEGLVASASRAADGDWRLLANGDDFGLDVTWTAVAAPHEYRRGSRYEQPGWATGTVSVGGVTHPVDGPGQRDQSWGVRDWWRLGWTWCAGWLDDGERFQATALHARGRIAPDGYVLSANGVLTPVHAADVSGAADGHGSVAVLLDDRRFTLDEVASATVELTAPDGRRSHLVRTMSTVRGPAGQGGVGWRERNIPAGGPGRPT